MKMTGDTIVSDGSIPAEALFAPATVRNGAAILDVLRAVLPRDGLVLELASGSGEHAVRFAGALPELRWQPSDPDRRALGSIAAHARGSGLTNLLPPFELDARAEEWPVGRADAVVCINMIHIAPWAATEGLMAGAGRLLPDDGPLVVYGPYRIDGAHTAPSNALFDEDLRRRDPAWGVRDLGDVVAVAQAQGLRLAERIAMPANNLSLVFRKAGGAGR
jgi:SAM-dependent methyltransferase